MQQIDKDYYWNQANKLARNDLKSQRKKLMGWETDKSTIPEVDEVREVKEKVVKKSYNPSPKELERILIRTRGGVKYLKSDVGIPQDAKLENTSYYKTDYNDWVTYRYVLGKKYWTVTLGNKKYDIVSVHEFEL